MAYMCMYYVAPLSLRLPCVYAAIHYNLVTVCPLLLNSQYGYIHKLNYITRDKNVQKLLALSERACFICRKKNHTQYVIAKASGKTHLRALKNKQLMLHDIHIVLYKKYSA